MQQIAPGFVTRQVVPCRACRGRGEIINGILLIIISLHGIIIILQIKINVRHALEIKLLMTGKYLK